MAEKNSVVAVFETHNQAEDAVRELQKDGFDMKKPSIVRKDYHTDEPLGQEQHLRRWVESADSRLTLGESYEWPKRRTARTFELCPYEQRR